MDIDNLTPEQIEEARAIVAADYARKAAQEAAARAAYLAPVLDLVNGDAFKATYEALKAMRAGYSDNGNFSLHVNALVDISERLAQAAGVNLNPPAPPPVIPVVEPEDDD